VETPAWQGAKGQESAAADSELWQRSQTGCIGAYSAENGIARALRRAGKFKPAVKCGKIVDLSW